MTDTDAPAAEPNADSESTPADFDWEVLWWSSRFGS